MRDVNLATANPLTLCHACRDVEVCVANPDEPLSDAAIRAMATLLLATDENDGRTGTTGVSRES